MNTREYQEAAKRTICDQDRARQRIAGRNAYPVTDRADVEDLSIIQLNHATVGLIGEAGELAQLLERHVYYGEELDRVKIGEELGDILWYVAEACSALHLDLGRIMEANLAKLAARYPEKYNDERAKRENRDQKAEQKRVADACRTFPPYRDNQPNPFGYEEG